MDFEPTCTVASQSKVISNNMHDCTTLYIVVSSSRFLRFGLPVVFRTATVCAENGIETVLEGLLVLEWYRNGIGRPARAGMVLKRLLMLEWYQNCIGTLL